MSTLYSSLARAAVMIATSGALMAVASPIPTLTVATPQFTPEGGTYPNSITVTITSPSTAASLYYTLDGTDPTTASSLYRGPFTLESDALVKARGFQAGMNPSAVASQSFIISRPVITLQNDVAVGNLAGTAFSQRYFQIIVPAGQTLLTVKTSGGTGNADLFVRFGALPTVSMFDYRSDGGGNTESVTINNPVAGYWYIMLRGGSAYSDVALQAAYSGLMPTLAAPQISPAGGEFANNVTVSIAATNGASVYYTLDGSYPTIASTLYTGPFTLNCSAVVQARAFKMGMNPSVVASQTYTISQPVTLLANHVPVTDLAGVAGSQSFYQVTVPWGQSILTIETAGGMGNADLYVRFGALPTLTMFDFRPALPGNDEAVAVQYPAAGYWYIMLRGATTYSNLTLTAAYSNTVPTVATPQFSPPGGEFANSVGVSITTATSGAKVYYTLDGSLPTTISLLYTGAFTLARSAVVSARAFMVGMNPSVVASQTYTIGSPVTDLVNDLPVTNLAGANGGQSFYQLTVPPGQSLLNLKTMDGTGNADLYVRWGALPTTNMFDFQSTQGGNLEAVTVHYPRPGLWYLLLQANPDYSGLTLVGGYTNSPAFPGAACLLTPVNNPSLRTRRPQFVWSQPTPSATWFYLWLNHDGLRYKDFWINTGTDGGGGTNWLPALDLPAGSYQWWVQTWNPNGYGPWSSSGGFTIPLAMPSLVDLISPSGVALSSARQRYLWQTDPNATWYELYVNLNGRLFLDRWFALTDLMIDISSGTTAVTVGGHSVGNYQSWVRGWSPDGYGPWSRGLSFTLPAPNLPGTVTLLTPAVGDNVLGQQPQLSWSQSTPAADWFHVWLNNGGVKFMDTWVEASTNWTSGAGLPPGNYQWWVQGWNLGGYGQWSSSSSFAVP